MRRFSAVGKKVAEKRDKGVEDIPVDGDQRFWGFPMGLMVAPDGNGKRQSKQEKLG